MTSLVAVGRGAPPGRQQRQLPHPPEPLLDREFSPVAPTVALGGGADQGESHTLRRASVVATSVDDDRSRVARLRCARLVVRVVRHE